MTIKEYLHDKKIPYLLREGWSVSWPMTLIMFFIFLIGFADVYVAGRFGKEVKAAYGLVFQIYFVFLIIAMALSVGAVSVISRLFTSGKKDELISAISSSLITAAVAGCLLGGLGVAFGGTIITGLRMPPAIREFAISFISIYATGILFHYMIMNTNAILRACKRVRKSLWTMAVVCTLNISLNFLLSFHTPLRFKGIAVATVASLFVGGMINIRHVRKHLLTDGIRFSFFVVKKIMHISWPAGLLHILWQLGAMMLFLILSRLPVHNVETMAAFTNGLKIESAIFLPAFAFNMANAVVVGNLLGSRNERYAVRGGAVNCLVGVLFVIMLTLIVMAGARHIAAFLSTNEIVINESVKYIFIALLFEPVMACGIILAGGLNGAGDTKTVMLIVALSIWLVRIPLSYVAGIYLGLGAVGVWWAMNISILVQTIFICRRYFGRRWITERPVVC